MNGSGGCQLSGSTGYDGLCCGGHCINPQTDPQNCETCGTVCQNGYTCGNGGCACFDQSGTYKLCDANQTCCAGACVNLSVLQTDPNNCGSCGNVCGTGETCCAGKCVNLQSDSGNCNSCGNACGSGEDCCNGSCLGVQKDANNCGSCGHVCNIPNGNGVVCQDGRCEASSCAAGYQLCNQLTTLDEVCADLNNDPNNCGTCRYVCPSDSPVCCGGVCKDTSSDTDNCGTCGHVCDFSNAAGGLCVQGFCDANGCDTGYDFCQTPGNVTCRNLQTDPNNCGSCGHVCDVTGANGVACVRGTCYPTSCQAGYTLCKDAGGNYYCANLTSDYNNCGTCGNVCPCQGQAGGQCLNGHCCLDHNAGCYCGNLGCCYPTTGTGACGAFGYCY